MVYLIEPSALEQSEQTSRVREQDLRVVVGLESTRGNARAYRIDEQHVQVDLDGLFGVQVERKQKRLDAERDDAESVVEFGWQVDAVVHHDLDDRAEHERRVHGDVLSVAFLELPRVQHDRVGRAHGWRDVG